MNDTDIYADRYRVDYHPDPGIEDPATHPFDPRGHGLETPVQTRGEAG